MTMATTVLTMMMMLTMMIMIMTTVMTMIMTTVTAMMRTSMGSGLNLHGCVAECGHQVGGPGATPARTDTSSYVAVVVANSQIYVVSRLMDLSFRGDGVFVLRHPCTALPELQSAQWFFDRAFEAHTFLSFTALSSTPTHPTGPGQIDFGILAAPVCCHCSDSLCFLAGSRRRLGQLRSFLF